MSGELNIRLAVLFDHELRLAADALHALHDENTNAYGKAILAADALRKAYLALYAIRKDTQAIAVISVSDERHSGTMYVPAADKKPEGE